MKCIVGDVLLTKMKCNVSDVLLTKVAQTRLYRRSLIKCIVSDVLLTNVTQTTLYRRSFHELFEVLRAASHKNNEVPTETMNSW